MVLLLKLRYRREGVESSNHKTLLSLKSYYQKLVHRRLGELKKNNMSVRESGVSCKECMLREKKILRELDNGNKNVACRREKRERKRERKKLRQTEGAEQTHTRTHTHTEPHILFFSFIAQMC